MVVLIVFVEAHHVWIWYREVFLVRTTPVAVLLVHAWPPMMATDVLELSTRRHSATILANQHLRVYIHLIIDVFLTKTVHFLVLIIIVVFATLVQKVDLLDVQLGGTVQSTAP